VALTISGLHPVIAGEVTGVDLTKPISREEAATIEAGMDRYGVLVFRGQAISDEQQIAFTRNFGELESYNTSGTVRKREDNRLGPGIADLSNLTKDGKIISAEDRVWFFKLGDRLWHSDSSFRPVPAKYSLLSGRTVPSWGGNTEFADMRAAYEALDPRIWSASTPCSIRARRSDSRSSRRKRSKISSPYGILWCACRRRPAGNPCTCRPMPVPSWVGRSRRRAPSCVTSPSTRPAASSSMRIPGDGTIWWCGTTAR
jgi:alpha-ketoglutarate-dependent taurine dioxygenase